MPTIASLVGTTPCAPVAPVIMVPSGSREAVTRPAPAPMSRKPSVALMAPPMTCPAPLFMADSPTVVMMPMRNAGTDSTSLNRKLAMERRKSMIGVP